MATHTSGAAGSVTAVLVPTEMTSAWAWGAKIMNEVVTIARVAKARTRDFRLETTELRIDCIFCPSELVAAVHCPVAFDLKWMSPAKIEP